ncbi:MAG TPA: hypothetical protein VIR79_02730 [Nitrospira sp.]
MRATLIGALLVALSMAVSVEVATADSPLPRKIVAAGLGYQDADSSSITVKTYDAVTGTVLSAENYELDIKDDAPSGSEPRTRIFAGGVGVGADGLSEFTIRVYDAVTGRFLWEGRLNLGVGIDSGVAASPVVAMVQSRAAVLKISTRPRTSGQPYFVLRAMNPETGQVVWADQFSTDPANVRVERINRSVIGMNGVIPREIDFRIKMPDEAGRQLLWEDQVIAGEEADLAKPERSEDNPRILPAVPSGLDQRHKRSGV